MARGTKIEVTQKDRDEVKKLAMIGVRYEDIALIKGWSADSLTKYCAAELKEGSASGKTRVISTAYSLATSGKCPAMTMFWLKTKDRWREVDRPDELSPPKSKPLVLGTKDPIEAAKIYQRIMGEEIKNDEPNSNIKT